MAKYRIKVEVLTDETELMEELRTGIECEGFTIIAERGDDQITTAFHNVSVDDVAGAIEANDELMEAAIIANGMRQAHNFRQQTKHNAVIEALFRMAERKAKEQI